MPPLLGPRPSPDLCAPGAPAKGIESVHVSRSGQLVTLRITSSVKPWNPVCRASCFIISVSTPKTRARVLEQNGCNRELSPVFGRNPKDEGLVSTIYLPSESSRFSSNTLSTVRKCSFSPPVVPLLRGFG